MQDTESAAVKLIHENEGRLESEVKNVMTIVRKLTRDSLFLFDETFASTGAADAVRLSRNLIEKICVFRMADAYFQLTCMILRQ